MCPAVHGELLTAAHLHVPMQAGRFSKVSPGQVAPVNLLPPREGRLAADTPFLVGKAER